MATKSKSRKRGKTRSKTSKTIGKIPWQMWLIIAIVALYLMHH